MYKYILMMLLWANVSFAATNEVSEARQSISGSLNQAVVEIKGLFKQSNDNMGSVNDKDTQNKARVQILKQKSEENESNPTVLNHAKKSIPSCDYNTKNLVWNGTSWQCVKMNVDTECQAAAPDEYMYTDSKGHKVCAKSPKGVSINYFYKFRGYSSKCTGAYKGYEKLYDCKYRNKLGQEIEVSSSYCSGKSKPSVGNKLCAKSWTVGSWSGCSRSCGGGTRSRSVYCQAGYDCSMYSRPSSSTSCNTQKCAGSWSTGSWSSCSAKACGTSGSQTRSVTCPSSLDCSGSPKPSPSRSCSAPACAVQCTWSTGSWSSCSATKCGTSGKQTRSVTKSGPAGCTGPSTPKPKDSQSCSAGACTAVCTWSTGNWSACSTTACGTTGTKTRSVWKSGAAGCTGPTSPKPAASQSCTNSPCNYTYSWRYGSWGSCSVRSCGTGTQTRPYRCVRSDGKTVANSYCSGRPLASQSCSAPCNGCTLKHPVGWDRCVEYYLSSKYNLRTSTLPHGASRSFNSSYGGRGSITIKCDNGSLRIVRKNCRGSSGGPIVDER